MRRLCARDGGVAAARGDAQDARGGQRLGVGHGRALDLELLRDETNEKLPEGQLRLLVKDTLSQLEQFMKTLGCELS